MDQPIKRVRGRTCQYIWMWLPVVIYIVMIMFMAAQPSPNLPRVKYADKFAHACAYGILGILSYRPFLGTGSRRPVLMTMILGFAVGIADEGIQLLGRVRTADRYDLLADLMGAAVGALVISRLSKPCGGADSRNEAR